MIGDPSGRNKTRPPLTETEVIDWGKRLIDGEVKRKMNGNSPITNPTIAVVRVHYDNFIEANNAINTEGAIFNELRQGYADVALDLKPMKQVANNIFVDAANLITSSNFASVAYVSSSSNFNLTGALVTTAAGTAGITRGTV